MPNGDRCANVDCLSPRIKLSQLGEGTVTYFCLVCGATFHTPARVQAKAIGKATD